MHLLASQNTLKSADFDDASNRLEVAVARSTPDDFSNAASFRLGSQSSETVGQQTDRLFSTRWEEAFS